MNADQKPFSHESTRMHTNSKTGHKKCDLSLRQKKRFGIKATEEIRIFAQFLLGDEINRAPAKTFTDELR